MIEKLRSELSERIARMDELQLRFILALIKKVF